MKNISTANITTNETALTFDSIDKAMKDLQKMGKPLLGWKLLRSELVPFDKAWPVKYDKIHEPGIETLLPCKLEEAEYVMISTETLNHYTKGGDV